MIGRDVVTHLAVLLVGSAEQNLGGIEITDGDLRIDVELAE